MRQQKAGVSPGGLCGRAPVATGATARAGNAGLDTHIIHPSAQSVNPPRVRVFARAWAARCLADADRALGRLELQAALDLLDAARVALGAAEVNP